jgi:hypothetical protein
MTTSDKQALLIELNNVFNESVKYLQFRFNELAAKINSIPTTEPKKEGDPQ